MSEKGDQKSNETQNSTSDVDGPKYFKALETKTVAMINVVPVQTEI